MYQFTNYKSQTNFYVIIITIVIFFTNILSADEKKIKTRGFSDISDIKNIEINISPDLINLEDLKKLKKNFKTASNYASVLDEKLDDKKRLSIGD